MPSDVNRKIYTIPRLPWSTYNIWMKTIHNSLTFDISDVAKYRLHVLNCFYIHGLKVVMDTFKVKKSTLYDWKRVYESSGKKMSSLIPKSTRPKKTRTMYIDWELVEFIRAFREEYGNIGKVKIKPFLDAYAKEVSLKSYGTTKIGRIINRKNLFFDGKVKVKQKRPLVPRLKYAPKEKTPGYIEMDTVTLYVVSRKYYFITAIDIVTKFAYCKLAKSLSSRQAKLALEGLMTLYLQPPRVIQTDNGSEFLGEFHQHTQDLQIKHEFIYPRSPRINGVVERFNRTLKEEFLTRNSEIYYSTSAFNQKLTKYLKWYNYKRPHHSLKLQSPVSFMQQFL